MQITEAIGKKRAKWRPDRSQTEKKLEMTEFELRTTDLDSAMDKRVFFSESVF